MPAYRTFAQHLDRHLTPKRILALDGGGIRGVLTLGMLREIETLLRARVGGDPQFRLADYFDLIGGTSTGAIIAAGLATGMSVDEIHGHYLNLGNAVFKRSLLRKGVFREKFDAADVSRALKSVFGDRTLGDPGYRTGLLVMSKRLDSASPWPLTNNPQATFFAAIAGSSAMPNGEFPLWKVVRASTAAPSFFGPETIQITKADTARGLKGVLGEFVDGGVSPSNNPALQLLLTATIEGYRFGWQTGADRLLVVSLGTGRRRGGLDRSTGLKATAGVHAVRALASLMDDCADLVETVMQWLSSSATARDIDLEILTASPPLSGTPAIGYVRYNVFLERDWCKTHLGLDRPDSELEKLTAMDEPKNIEALDELGRVAGKKLVNPAHFPARFDEGVAV
jgi:predicted acylesterase/phospholipase RssA